MTRTESRTSLWTTFKRLTDLGQWWLLKLGYDLVWETVPSASAIMLLGCCDECSSNIFAKKTILRSRLGFGVSGSRSRNYLGFISPFSYIKTLRICVSMVWRTYCWDHPTCLYQLTQWLLIRRWCFLMVRSERLTRCLIKSRPGLTLLAFYFSPLLTFLSTSSRWGS